MNEIVVEVVSIAFKLWMTFVTGPYLLAYILSLLTIVTIVI